MMASQERMCGAFGKERSAVKKTQELADSVYDDVVRDWQKICKKSNTDDEISEYRAVSYKSQVVAGTNYIIRVQIGPDRFIAIKVYEPLPYAQAPNQLKGIVADKREELQYSWFSQ